MELKDFVSRTLVELQGAIRSVYKETGVGYSFAGTKDQYGKGSIKFDVAVEAGATKSSDKEAGIRVPVVNLGGKLGTVTGQSDKQSSRIQFELRVDKNPSKILNPKNPSDGNDEYDD